MTLTDQVKAEEDKQRQEEEERAKNIDPAKKKSLDKMTQSLIDDALTSKASIHFNNDGGIDVSVVDGNAETRLIKDQNKKAIKEALSDRNNELGIKAETKKVEAPAPVNVTAKVEVK